INGVYDKFNLSNILTNQNTRENIAKNVDNILAVENLLDTYWEFYGYGDILRKSVPFVKQIEQTPTCNANVPSTFASFAKNIGELMHDYKNKIAIYYRFLKGKQGLYNKDIEPIMKNLYEKIHIINNDAIHRINLRTKQLIVHIQDVLNMTREAIKNSASEKLAKRSEILKYYKEQLEQCDFKNDGFRNIQKWAIYFEAETMGEVKIQSYNLNELLFEGESLLKEVTKQLSEVTTELSKP
ncbi:MAG: hypothetical protein JW841_02010, partial [Deltaproteobacteria bacterium]|nr:hypothetical protein [Deltaproteobacteria bacterium]